MTRSELHIAVSERTGYAVDEVEFILQGLFDTVVEEVSKGEEVRIKNFGKFYLKNFRSRTVFNPTTGKRAESKQHLSLAFKPGKANDNL